MGRFSKHRMYRSLYGEAHGVVARSVEPQGDPRPFASDAEFLDAALQLFSSRGRPHLSETTVIRRGEPPFQQTLESQWSAYFHGCLALTAADHGLLGKGRAAGLDPTEWEIAAVLALNSIGMIGSEINTCAEVIEFLGVSAAVTTLQRLSENGKLRRSGIVISSDLDDDLPRRRVAIANEIADALLPGERTGGKAWEVKKEENLYSKMRKVAAAFRALVPMHSPFMIVRATPERSDFRRRDRVLGELEATLKAHPDWLMSKLLFEDFELNRREQWVVVALLARALGNLEDDDPLFSGRGLVFATMTEPMDIEEDEAVVTLTGSDPLSVELLLGQRRRLSSSASSGRARATPRCSLRARRRSTKPPSN